MPPELLVEERGGYRYAALVAAGNLIDLAADRLDRPCLYQSIWRAKIDRIVPQVGAFATLGERTGLLRDANRKSGDSLIVQVKSRRGEGKADIITDDVALGGRYFVYLPKSDKIAVSKKSAPKEAVALVAALQAVGIFGGILRSGAGDVPPATVITEAVVLQRQWREIESQTGPMLRAGPDATHRLIHDYPRHDLRPIETDFAARGLDEQIAALLQPEIKLAKGGSVIIERTSALTAIDVNAATRSQAETDTEALAVIAAQIRLRNLSGLIVIDFTSAVSKQSTPALLQSVRRALADDPAGCRVAGVTPSGLVELTRPARDLPLLEKLARSGHDEPEG